MTAPATLCRPYSHLVLITILDRAVEVPDNTMVLRCFQYLAPEAVAYGRFCWNEECQYCRVTYDLGEGTATRAALACKLPVQDGMRVKSISTEIRYCLRELNLAADTPSDPR